MRKLLLLLLLFFSLLFTFLSLSKQNHTAQAQSTTVVIKNNAFSPQTITIQAGNSITWRNDDNIDHTATSDTGIWDSPRLDTGQTYTKVFSTPGTYTYHCALHPNMKATIIVTAATPTTISTQTPTPPQNISPTFACLGACPITTSPAPTSTPLPTASTITPIPTIDYHNPCEETLIQPKNTNDIQAMYRGGRRGGRDNDDRRSRQSSNDDSLLGFLISILQLLFQLLGFGPSPAPQPIPTAAPTPVPTNIPTPLLTTEPSPTPCPGSPTPTGKISIDDLKYHPGTEALRHFDLIAEPISATQWTYNSDLSQNKTPGPEWRVVQGDHVQVSFINHLAEATTVHWHGVRVEASQDGVPGITQNSIPPGGTYQYDFTVPDAGTYWFHPHQNSQTQVPKGLIGTIVVEPRIPAADDMFQKDHTIVYNNTVKSTTNTQLQANPGERVRLRIIDGREPDFSGTPLRIALVGAPFKVFAIDGQKINQPQQLSSQLIEMGMGNRVDLDFIMPATGTVKLLESQNLQNFTIGTGADPAIPNLNTLPTFSYLNYGVKTADPRLPKTTFDAEYTLNLGADLSINGKLFPNVPDMVVTKGQLTKITYVNNSNLTHPMHIHGQFLTVLEINDVPLTGSPVHLDTVLVKPGEKVEAAVLADNEGIWMIHCHVLQHAVNGMMMLNKYDNVYSPYQFGPGTQNNPQ